MVTLRRAEPGNPQSERYEAVQQYSLGKILGVWAAAALPMGFLSWVAAPWLSHRLGGEEPLVGALLICITLGLIWQFVLVMVLLRRELGTLASWPRVRDGLWLRPPRDPGSGRVGGRVWLWVLPFMAIFGARRSSCPGSPPPRRAGSPSSSAPTPANASSAAPGAGCR